eukprot:1696255-Alexandrium_andersonii.AAC.1
MARLRRQVGSAARDLRRARSPRHLALARKRAHAYARTRAHTHTRTHAHAHAHTHTRAQKRAPAPARKARAPRPLDSRERVLKEAWSYGDTSARPLAPRNPKPRSWEAVSYTHLRAHETSAHL